MNIRLKASVTLASLALLTAPFSNPQAARAATPGTSFIWNEVPQNQDVPITRAVFDRGGYQLRDKAGETIVVPNASNNQCPLKFARSNNGGMYLVNEGCSPVLYMPARGELDNGTVPRARWYPFAHGYTPSHPVYMSVAPDVASYDHMGWYPGMTSYGGYSHNNYGDSGPSLIADIGLIFLIGGHHYDGWAPYNSYCGHHQTNYHTAYYDPQVYAWAGRPQSGRVFGGGHRMWAHRSISSPASQPRVFAALAAARSFHGGLAFGGKTVRTMGRDTSGVRVFRGAGPAFHGTYAKNMGHNPSTAHVFRGASPAFGRNAGTRRSTTESARRADAPSRRVEFHGKDVRSAERHTGSTLHAASHEFHGATVRSVEYRSARERASVFSGRSAGQSFHQSKPRIQHQSFGGFSRSSGSERQFGGGGHQSGGNRSPSGGGRQFGGNRGQSSGGGRQSGGRGGGGHGDDHRRG